MPDRDDQHTIQLRVSLEEYEALERAIKVSGRSIPSEIRHRLEAYRSGAAGGEARAIGAVATEIADRATKTLAREVLPPGADAGRAQFLGLVRDGLAFVLNALGAAKSDELVGGHGDFPLSAGIAWDLPGKIKNPPRPIPADHPEWVDTSWEDRIGAALGFRDAPKKPADRSGSKGGEK